MLDEVFGLVDKYDGAAEEGDPFVLRGYGRECWPGEEAFLCGSIVLDVMCLRYRSASLPQQRLPL